MIWTVETQSLAFAVYAGQPWSGRCQFEIRVRLGRLNPRPPEGELDMRAELSIELGRTYESVIDHNHQRRWLRFLPWANWCSTDNAYAKNWPDRTVSWTGRPWIFTGFDWPLRISFWTKPHQRTEA